MLRLGGIAKVTAGQAAPKQFGNDGYPFIRAGHLEELIKGKSLNDLPKVTEEISKKHKLNLLPKNSIVFAKSGMSATKNRIYVLKGKAYFVSHLAAILPNDNIDMSYLAKFLFWYNPTNLVLDEAYPSIRLEDINNLKIPLPPLPQQQKIANVLDAADALRQNDKALIAKYDELTQALFLDMFGDYLNDKLYPLKDLVKFSQGQQFGVEQQLLEPKEGYARFLRIVDYTQGEDLRFVPNNSKNYYVSKEDIVIVRYGASAGFVGTNKEGVLANNLFKVNYDKQMYNQAFLYFIFQNDRFKKFVNKEAFGAAMPALSFKVMERFEIPVPPLHIQNQFAERVAVIEEQKFIAQKGLEHSESLFNSLLQKAFKGELV